MRCDAGSGDAASTGEPEPSIAQIDSGNRVRTGGIAMATKKRELVEPHRGDKRFIRRDDHGRFAKSADVGRSLIKDVRKRAKTTVKSGQGDRGDRNA
jgi:hypothetical protein